MTLRPVADPISRLLFGEETNESKTLSENLESAVQALTGAALLEDTARQWTHADGRQVRARLVTATAHTVTIKREADGRVFTFEINKLSAADREFIGRWRMMRVQ